jgi:hypothetical protein
MSSATAPQKENHVLVLPVGDFGHAAAGHLKELMPSVDILAEATDSSAEALSKNPSAIVVLIAWRPVPMLSDLLDARSHSTGSTFVSLTIQDCTMLLGPIVMPGQGICWRCWNYRELESSVSPNVIQQRTTYYADHPTEGPRGYLPSFARLGAAQLMRSLISLESTVHSAGQVVRTNLYSRQITIGRAIGLDNCDRCGLHRPLPSRSYADLRTGLMSLWSQG